MLLIRMVAGFSFLLTFLLHPLPVVAQVSGLCSNCHTMHNSQDGEAVLESGGPLKTLLKSDCVGCHSSSGSETILTVGGTRTPIVYNHSEPAQALAGGNFYWVAQDNGDAFGHNVAGITVADVTLTDAPGGRVDCTDCHSSLATDNPENGCKGCHVPRHHADDSNAVVDGAGGWYRFLGDNPAMAAQADWGNSGVVGIEDADWEQQPTAGQHNVYQGTTTVYAYQPIVNDFVVDNSIGSFCAGCHGLFHHEMNEGQENFYTPGDVSGAWLRHPSDVVITAAQEGEEGSSYSSGGPYNPMVPVAKSTDLIANDANFAVVTPGSDVVTCISCHRAHGSPYPDMLRWDYQTDCKTGMPNDNCGCFSCHSAKDY